jgi:hypothetical protein
VRAAAYRRCRTTLHFMLLRHRNLKYISEVLSSSTSIFGPAPNSHPQMFPTKREPSNQCSSHDSAGKLEPRPSLHDEAQASNWSAWAWRFGSPLLLCAWEKNRRRRLIRLGRGKMINGTSTGPGGLGRGSALGTRWLSRSISWELHSRTWYSSNRFSGVVSTCVLGHRTLHLRRKLQE